MIYIIISYLLNINFKCQSIYKKVVKKMLSNLKKSSLNPLLLLLILFTIQILSQPKNYTILISFDGFRWDYLNRDLTPNLEKALSTLFRLLKNVSYEIYAERGMSSANL